MPSEAVRPSPTTACRLNADVLVLVRYLEADVRPASRLAVDVGLEVRSGRVEWCALPDPTGPLTLHLGLGELGSTDAGPPEAVHPEGQAGALRISEAAFVDAGCLLRDHLAPLPAEARNTAAAFIARATALVSAGEPTGVLSDILSTFCSTLRERLPHCEVRADVLPALAVDKLLQVDESCFYARGWLYAPGLQGWSLAAVSPEGHRVVFSDDMARHARPDLRPVYGEVDLSTRHGFAVLIELPTPSRAATGWTFELAGAGQFDLEVAAPPVTRVVDVTSELLQESAIDGSTVDQLRRLVLGPALARLQRHLQAEVRVTQEVQYGQPPTSPEVSVVVPLYQRIDFLEHQLAQFVQDAEMAETDLIYVLDSPEIAPALLMTSANLARLYGLAFRVAILNRNGGYALANNAGAALARGRKLVLLNSDVLPDRPGWLGALCRASDAISDVGAVGAKLLYEDDSVQHAGMHFERRAYDTTWTNVHRYKGLHRSLPAVTVSRQVPAVTGACLMVDRELYLDVGGLNGGYVRGDYEDSDFCLRLTEKGLRNWYEASVELYHLEGQSYPSAIRRLASEHNRWLHTEAWRSMLEGYDSDPR